MTALKIVGVLLLLLLLLGAIPLGVNAAFGEETRVRLRVGVFRLTLYPRKEKKPTPPKEKKQKEKRPLPKPTSAELRELLDAALSALARAGRRFRRAVRIDPLDVTVVFGGDDPADTARAFGRANAAMYLLMPRLEELFRIPAPSLHLRVDFSRERTAAAGTVGVSLRLWRLIALMITLAAPLLRWLRRLRAAHRDDPKRAEDDTEERIA